MTHIFMSHDFVMLLVLVLVHGATIEIEPEDKHDEHWQERIKRSLLIGQL